MRGALLLALALALLLALPLSAQDDEAADREVSQLLAQVDGFDDLLRERASRRLVELGEAALPALKERLGKGGARAADYREMIDRIEARRALRKAEQADEKKHEGVLAEEKLLREHWEAFRLRYLRTKVERAEDLGRAGKQTEALDLLAAIVRVEPRMPEALGKRVDALRKKLKAQRFRKTAVDGKIELARTVYRWGQPIKLTFAITNNGKQDFLIKTGTDDKRSQIHLHYKIRDVTLYGLVRAAERTAEVSLGSRDITLAPGQTWRKSASLTLPDRPGAAFLYREVVVTSRALPSAMGAAAKLLDQLTIRFPEQRLRVFPAGYEKHAARPLKSLAGAIKLGQPDAIFVAGLLVPPHRHKEAIGLLVQGLSRSRAPVQRTSMAVLERLTGEKPKQASTWALWWRANRESFEPRER